MARVLPIDRRQGVEFDPVRPENLQARHHAVERRLPSPVDPVRIVQLARAVDADSDQKSIARKEIRPFRVEKDAVGLEGVPDRFPPAWRFCSSTASQKNRSREASVRPPARQNCHVFKVPSLRNVARTAPYFHDGSVATLGEAVSLMARYQLGRDLDDTDRSDLVAFLESLTGSYQGRPL